MRRWDSLRGPLQYQRRSPEQQAADAQRAYAALEQGGPTNLGEASHAMYLRVLRARMLDPSSSLAEVAAAMSPPMTKEAFAAQLRRAHAAADVPFTLVPREANG